MVVALLEYQVGGESLQVESKWVGAVRALPLATFVKSIKRHLSG